VIHTDDGADKIWIGSDGVAIDDLSKDDRLTIAGVLPLFGGIRNGNKDTPYGYSYGGAVRWAEDVDGALQVSLFGGPTTYILNWGSSGGMSTPFENRPGHISLFTVTYEGVYRTSREDQRGGNPYELRPQIRVWPGERKQGGKRRRCECERGDQREGNSPSEMGEM